MEVLVFYTLFSDNPKKPFLSLKKQEASVMKSKIVWVEAYISETLGPLRYSKKSLNRLKSFSRKSCTLPKNYSTKRNIAIYKMAYGYALPHARQGPTRRDYSRCHQHGFGPIKVYGDMDAHSLASYRKEARENWDGVEELIENGFEHLVEHNERNIYLCRRALVYAQADNHPNTKKAFQDCIAFIEGQVLFPNTEIHSLWTKVQRIYSERFKA